MNSVHFTKHEQARLRAVWLIMMASLALLAFLLWRIQLSHGERYEISLEQQSIRRVQIPGTRGRIMDRHGVGLADNQPNYCVALFLEELRRPGKRWVTLDDAWALVQRVAEITGITPSLTRAQVATHLYNRKALPLIVGRHLDERSLARLAEVGLGLPAVEILTEADRVYPQGTLASHVLGYVGAPDPKDEDRNQRSYWPVMIGKRGLEKRYDDLLRGTAGGRLVRVDVSGFKHDEIGFRDPVPGGDLMLALDVAVQRSAEKALTDVVGAVVVMDPRNGDVLALASSPDFDPNSFSPSISFATWSRAVEDSRKPLFNRAVSGQYAPGSIFKPVVVLAALEVGLANAGTGYDCQGYYEIGRQRFSCFASEAHGWLNIREALMLSCNVFFYRLALLCGIDTIYQQALSLGLGQKTGIDLDAENAGLLPGKDWKRVVRGEGWSAGDTCNIGIGQGALLTTPIQMAVVAAAIANGGVVYRPRLVLSVRSPGMAEFREVPPVSVRDLKWRPENLALVKEGMRDVIENPSGTGRLAKVPDVIMAGKTGTSEFGRKGAGQQRGWMIVFAPYDRPRYAVAMVLDEAVTGGTSVGPRIRLLMDEILRSAEGANG